MGLMTAFAGGAAGAGADILQDQRKSDTQVAAAKSLADYNSELDIKRARVVEEMKNAGLNRISANARGKMGEEVPLEAAPVTAVSGTNEAGEKFGFEGDIATQRKAIETIADPTERAQAMAQLDNQVASDTKKGLINVAGKTRKRTAAEALDAAVEDAKANDLPAYADYESRVGKPLRDERRVDITEKKEENRYKAATATEQRKAEAELRKADVELRKLDLQEGNLAANNRKIDALIEHWERGDETKAAGGGKGQSPDKLGAIVNAMNATVAKLTSSDTPRGRTPEEKAEWQKAYDNAVRVRDRATQLLDSSLTDRGAPETPGANPKPAAAPAGLPQGARQIGTSGGRPVYETPDGKRFIQK